MLIFFSKLSNSATFGARLSVALTVAAAACSKYSHHAVSASKHADAGDDEEGALLRELMPPNDAGRTEIELHRAIARAAQRQADEFAHAVRVAADFLDIQVAADGDVAQRIEELDRQLELLVKELPHVGQRRRCRRSDRRAPAALPPCCER